LLEGIATHVLSNLGINIAKELTSKGGILSNAPYLFKSAIESLLPITFVHIDEKYILKYEVHDRYKSLYAWERVV